MSLVGFLKRNAKAITFLYIMTETIRRLQISDEEMDEIIIRLKEIDNEREQKRATQGKT